MSKSDVVVFVEESNRIEGVDDEVSHLYAKLAMFKTVAMDEMTEQSIFNIHKMLMTNQEIEEKYKGSYRDVPVSVGGRPVYPPEHIPIMMYSWVEAANNVKTWNDIKESHVHFEKIHPFIDGNGRIGRMLMNWQRLKIGLPILILYANERQDYYGWFK